MLNAEKIILDLCGGRGSWSEPYAEAGYDRRVITLPEYDVRSYDPPPNVWGILAAPPCTHFSLSGAQYWKAKDADGRTAEAVGIVRACLRIIEISKPKFWALENPRGRIQKLVPEIGPLKEEFDPCDFAGWGDMIYRCPCGYEFEYELGKYGCPNCVGENVAALGYQDAYTKKTRLWGDFVPPFRKKAPPVRYCKQGSWIQKLGGDSEKTKELRSITPAGFARAFYEANK